MRYRDSCTSNRPVADLLRWSMGSELRYSKGYTDYRPPETPARRPSPAGIGERLREAALKAVRALARRQRSTRPPSS